MTLILIKLIKLYKKFLSPLFPNSCRYYPSCSQYMIESINKKGTLTGLALGTLRIIKCNPFFPGGIDEVK